MDNINNNLSNLLELDKKKVSSQELVKKLVEIEKQARKNKPEYEFKQLIGTWRLAFITGTKNTRKTISNIIGAGFYIPSFINIYLSYSGLENKDKKVELIDNEGEIENTVIVGLIKITLTGPAKFISKKNIMAFDFNHLTLSFLGRKIYSTDVRGGKSSQEKFYQESINKQAFFAYFLIQENLVAARGRGGGLAVWQKKD